MLQDIYIAYVECGTCGHRYPMIYEWPSKKTYALADECCCDSPKNIYVISDTAFTPDEWFAYMEAKRGERT